MDTETGELMPWNKAKLRDPINLESFEHGETVQVKTGYFEVVKIDLHKQRIVLKPIPEPEENFTKAMAERQRAIEGLGETG